MFKHKKLIAATFIFFVLINTTYFWVGKLGMSAMLLIPLLVMAFIALFICLVRQLFLVFKGKFRDLTRVYLSIIMLVLLGLIAFRPKGIINYENFESKNLLIATRGGVAGCTFLLKLKENKTFYTNSICFGVDKITGTYTLRRDTIWFAYSSRNANEYQFALLKRSITPNNQSYLAINLYRSLTDTIPLIMAVEKNDLIKK